MNGTGPLLSVRDLVTRFRTENGTVHAVNGISYQVDSGESLAIVGESGSGKSVGVLSIMGLIPSPPGWVESGEVLLKGRDLLRLSADELRQVRGKDIAMVFQDPMTSLNPVLTIGLQLTEAIRAHQALGARAARDRAVEYLELVGIAAPRKRFDDYPHRFSGGQCQRIMIAMALTCEPDLLIADEPTTALDVTIQAQITELVAGLQQRLGMAIIWITHDLGVVAGLVDRVAVMYAGNIVEMAPVAALYAHASHPYTRGLLESIPSIATARGRLAPIPGSPPDLLEAPVHCPFVGRCRFASARCFAENPGMEEVADRHYSACWNWREVRDIEPPETTAKAAPETPQRTASEVLLEVRDLETHFPIRRGVLRRTVGYVKAVDGVSLTIERGETLGLVGESGCGKSTTGQTILQLVERTAGEVVLDGRSLTELDRPQLRKARRDMQMIFQDPYASLNPRMTAGNLIGEALRIHAIGDADERRRKVVELLDLVGLDRAFVNRYPHEFSGGQRQRIGIARALATAPSFIVADEPISALDVSIQAQIVNLLQDLKARLELTYLFIAHDLAMVRYMSDRVAVMYLGRIVEIGAKDDVFDRPLHPYTSALLSAIPVPDPTAESSRRRIVLEGDVPDPAAPPPGCPFHPRCRHAEARCMSQVPVLRALGPSHEAACHIAEQFG
ncbi:MAG: ABC transporter ATP-binding protein [Gammaproteobacteria bacterium]